MIVRPRLGVIVRRLPALLVFPTLLVVVVLWLADARGPFWLGRNLDPDFVYLLNGFFGCAVAQQKTRRVEDEPEPAPQPEPEPEPAAEGKPLLEMLDAATE